MERFREMEKNGRGPFRKINATAIVAKPTGKSCEIAARAADLRHPRASEDPS
jgi:hypothetical protein